MNDLFETPDPGFGCRTGGATRFASDSFSGLGNEYVRLGDLLRFADQRRNSGHNHYAGKGGLRSRRCQVSLCRRGIGTLSSACWVARFPDQIPPPLVRASETSSSALVA